MAPLLTGTSDTDADGATGVEAVVLPTDLPAASLIQVTALPPAMTSLQDVLPKLPYHRQLNLLYLIPLFIALGVVLGAITAVILFKWRENRRCLLRTSSFLPGPPYAPPASDVEDRLLVHGYPSMEHVSLFAAATPSKFTVHGSRYTPKRMLVWKTLDGTQSHSSQPTYTGTIIPSSDGERFTVVTEEDPFLATSPVLTPKSPNDASLPQIRVSSSVLEPTPRNKSGDLEAQDKLPKPFRRSMFDILKLKGPYHPVPSARKEYTVITPDEEPADKTPTNGMRRVSSLKTTLAGDSRSRSARRSLDGGFDTNNTKDALGILGSQGENQDLADAPVVLPKQTLRVKQRTPSSPAQREKMKKPRKVTPFASEGSPKEATRGKDEPENRNKGDEIEEEKHSDIYTEAPQRRRSRTPCKRPSTGGPSRRSSAPDIHASVLPLSPPSLMSPPLEKSLFFTSSLSSSASLAGCMNSLATSHSSPLHHVHRSPELSLFPLPSNKTKTPKKLRTKKPEPPLPYPSYPNHVHAQTTSRERSASTDTKRQSVSPGSPKPKGRSTSATLRESPMGIWSLGSLSQTSLAIALASSSSTDMLHKVNDIVAQGYTKKGTSLGGADDSVAASLP